MLAFWMRAVAAVSIGVLTACSDEQSADVRGEKSELKSEQNDTVGQNDSKDEWLELSEGLTATEWLSSRSAAVGKSLSGKEIAQLEVALATAASRLGESPRMIANRSVQLEVMLHDLGYDQGAIDLIQQLTSVIGESGQTEGFGAISQHYYTMRKNGLTADQALDDLKRRYGPRG